MSKHRNVEMLDQRGIQPNHRERVALSAMPRVKNKVATSRKASIASDLSTNEVLESRAR